MTRLRVACTVAGMSLDRGNEGAGLASLARKLFWRAKGMEPEALAALHRWRRSVFVTRLRVAAAWHRATVEIDIAPDVRFGRGVRATVYPESRNVVRIGSGSSIGDRVLFNLKDATLLFGDRVEIRRDTVFHFWGGRLELAGENILSWGNVVHCAKSIRFGRLTSAAEYVTIVDSTHYFTEPDRFFYHNTITGPVEIGYNTWICPKVTVSRARIGDHCILGANSLVTGEVPSGRLVSGVPAVVVREVPRPWVASARELVAEAPRRRKTTRKPPPPSVAEPEPPGDAGAGSV